MAQVNNRIVGFSGRIGDLIFYRSGGKEFVRRCSRGRRDAQTPGQLLQRQRMRGVVKMYQALRATFVHRVWQQLAQMYSLSAYQLFIQHNIRAFDGRGGIIFDRLHFSAGILPLPANLSAERTGPTEVKLTWQNPGVFPREKMSDRLVVVVVGEDTAFYLPGPESVNACRGAQQALLSLQERETPSHLYCFFASANGQEFSDNVYFKVK